MFWPSHLPDEFHSSVMHCVSKVLDFVSLQLGTCLSECCQLLDLLDTFALGVLLITHCAIHSTTLSLFSNLPSVDLFGFFLFDK